MLEKWKEFTKLLTSFTTKQYQPDVTIALLILDSWAL